MRPARCGERRRRLPEPARLARNFPKSPLLSVIITSSRLLRLTIKGIAMKTVSTKFASFGASSSVMPQALGCSALLRLSAAVLLGSGLTMGTASTAFADTRQLTPVQSQVAQVQVTAQQAEVKVWMDRPNKAYPNKVYAPGERAKIYLRSTADVYIAIVNIGADGKANLVFPNRFSQNNFLRADTTVVVPGDSSYEIAVSGPAGVNLLKVVSSTENSLFPAESRGAGDFPELRTDPNSLSRQLQVVPTVAQKPDPRYSVSNLQFLVDNVALNTVSVPIAPPVSAAQNTSSPGSMTSVADALPVGQSTPSVALAPLPLRLRPSAFDLRLETDKPSYKVGERVIVRVTPERKCRLTLLDVAADGSYNIVLPNSLQDEVWADARNTTVYPPSDGNIEWRASSTGPRRLLAMCGANRTLSQYFSDRNSRSIVPKQPTLEQVLADQPKGDAANAVFSFVVNAN